jgi:hypothetical protein
MRDAITDEPVRRLERRTGSFPKTKGGTPVAEDPKEVAQERLRLRELRKHIGVTPETEVVLQALEQAEKENAPARIIDYLRQWLSFELGLIDRKPAFPTPEDLVPPEPDKPEEPTRLLADQRQPKPELPNSPAEPIEEPVEPELQVHSQLASQSAPQPAVKNKGGGQEFWDGEKLRDWLEQQDPRLRFGTIELFVERIRERIEPKPVNRQERSQKIKRYGLLFTSGTSLNTSLLVSLTTATACSPLKINSRTIPGVTYRNLP